MIFTKKFQLFDVLRYGRQIYGYESSWYPLQLLLNENFIGGHLGSWGQIQRQIFNFVRFQRLRCQIVGLCSTIKSCHSDPDVRPFLWGPRSTERSNFKLSPILTVEVSICRSWPNDQKLSWWPRCPTLPLGSKVNIKVKFSTLSDFDGWGVKL